MEEEMSMGTINDDAGFAELTAEFWENKKKVEEHKNVPESPTVVTKEKDESDLLIKEKSEVLTRERQQKKKVESYCIRTALDEDVFLGFKVLCKRMNVTMGVMTSRMITNLVEKNKDKVKIVINENAEV